MALPYLRIADINKSLFHFKLVSPVPLQQDQKILLFSSFLSEWELNPPKVSMCDLSGQALFKKFNTVFVSITPHNIPKTIIYNKLSHYINPLLLRHDCKLKKFTKKNIPIYGFNKYIPFGQCGWTFGCNTKKLHKTKRGHYRTTTAGPPIGQTHRFAPTLPIFWCAIYR